jgi:hypothetical protein
MTRATRVARWLAVFFSAYFLAIFAIIPVPFFSKEHAEQILPVVRPVILFLPVLDTQITSSYRGGYSSLSVHTHFGHLDMAFTRFENARTRIRSCWA